MLETRLGVRTWAYSWVSTADGLGFRVYYLKRSGLGFMGDLL